MRHRYTHHCPAARHRSLPNLQDADLEAKFACIEDADLWRWVLPDSRAFHVGLASMHLEYDANANPAIFSTLMALTHTAIVERVRSPPQRLSLTPRCSPLPRI
jgi:hypothetical protein